MYLIQASATNSFARSFGVGSLTNVGQVHEEVDIASQQYGGVLAISEQAQPFDCLERLHGLAEQRTNDRGQKSVLTVSDLDFVRFFIQDLIHPVAYVTL